MKKVVLTALNSSYSHTNLALRYIREKLCGYCEHGGNRSNPFGNNDLQVVFIESTINEQWLQVLDLLIKEKADVYAFSCYIWNRKMVESLSETLKKLFPRAAIIWGGPDASSQADSLLKMNCSVDAIICHEGDSATVDWILDFLFAPDQLLQPARIIRETEELNWHFPYTDQELSELSERILYYEGSRGCAFNCTYCLSCNSYRVRYKPLQEVFDELRRILDFNPRQLKFIDRTFNSNVQRASRIWRFLIDETKKRGSRTNFHFEIAAELISEQQIKLLSEAPSGLFQFEIGTQTTNPEVLKTIRRSYHRVKYEKIVNQLRKPGNIHIHLDLIAGLPGESLESQIKSANQVLRLAPNMLQLGFLKILPQTPIKLTCDQRGMIYQADPPYEIIASDAMNAYELMYWRRVEQIVDTFYNSDQFFYSLNYLLALLDQPFRILLLLERFIVETQGRRKLSQNQKYASLREFAVYLFKALKQVRSPHKTEIAHSLFKDCQLTEFGVEIMRNQGRYQRSFDDLLKIDYFKQGLKGFPDWFLSLHQNQNPQWRKRFAYVNEQNYLAQNKRRMRFEDFSFSVKDLPGIKTEQEFKGAGEVRPHPEQVTDYLLRQLAEPKDYIAAFYLAQGEMELVAEYVFLI